MMTSRFPRTMLALALVFTIGLIANLVFAPAADAQLRAALARTAGEDPSAPGALLPAAGDARFQLPNRLRISLSGMDPARFPADASCSATVRVGPASASGLVPVLVLAADPANEFGVDNTSVDFRASGTARAGDSAQVRIRCQFVVNGVRQRHETQYSGTLQ